MKTRVISCRVSEPFAHIIEIYVKTSGHLNPADLLRDAIREKISREASYLLTLGNSE
jgi:DNA-directed RNA polymerase subunit L